MLADMLQYSCLETPLPDREAWQAAVYRGTKSRTEPKRPCAHKHKTFFFLARGSSAPVRVEREGGAAVRLAGTLAAPNTDCPHHRSYDPIRAFFKPLVAGDQKVSLASLSSQLRQFRHLEGSLAWGPSLSFGHQAHRGAPWLGSYSADLRVRHLVGQPLYCSASDAGMWGERGYGDGSTPYV